MKQTSNYNLPILEAGDKYLKDYQNDAFSVIDTELKAMNDKINTLDNADGSILEISQELENTNAEIIDARVGQDTLGDKIRNIDTKLDTITKNKYDDVIISGNELSMKANGVVKKTIQLPIAGGIVEGHTHSNKSILDNITTNKVNNWNSAYEHSQSTHAPINAELNVQSNWTETNTSSDAYIKNKPIIPTVPSNLVTGSSNSYIIWTGTQSQYDSITTKDNNTLYFIKEE